MSEDEEDGHMFDPSPPGISLFVRLFLDKSVIGHIHIVTEL